MKFNKGDIVFVDTSDEDCMEAIHDFWRFGDNLEWVYDGRADASRYYDMAWVKHEGKGYSYRIAVCLDQLRVGYNELPPPMPERKAMEDTASWEFDSEGYDTRRAWMSRRIDEGYYVVTAARKFKEMDRYNGEKSKLWTQASRSAWAEAAEAEKNRNYEIWFKDLVWAFEIKKDTDDFRKIISLRTRAEIRSGDPDHGTVSDAFYWWVEFRNFERAYEEYRRPGAV